MGFLDKLKQTVDSGIAKGMAYVEQVAEAKKVEDEKRAAAEAERKAAEEKAEAERKTAEEKAEAERKAAEEKERAERQKKEQEELEKILAPSCEKGDCLWNSGKFYFTCLDDCECERKKYTKNRWADKSDYENTKFWPYMKRLEAIEKIDNNREIDFDIRSQKVRIMKNELVSSFQHEFFNIYDYKLKDILVEILFCNYGSGFSEKNYILKGLLKASKELHSDDIIKKFYYLAYEEHIHCDYPWLANTSLYNRSFEDMKYTVRTLEVVSSEAKLSKFFKDISNISIDQLYDENGNIKEAGRGGPEAGFYGDTIFNTVESWSGQNGENDVPRYK